MRLTDKIARDLACPNGMTERTFFDDDLPGFGLRVRPSGSRSWLAQYAIHGRTRKVTLGSPPIVTAGEARAAARKTLAQVKLGSDPARDRADAREQHVVTVGSLIPAFLERQAKRVKPRSLIESTRHLTQHAKPLHTSSIKAVDLRTIVQLLETIEHDNGPATANKVRADLSGFCTWAAQCGHIDTNPVALSPRAIERGARTRVLTDNELGHIWNAVEGDGDYCDIVRLLILTGLRRSEVADLSWSEISLDAALISLPPERTKTAKKHHVPLSAPALAILKARPRRIDRELVFGVWGVSGFTTFSQAKEALDEKLGDKVTPWVLHDLRRTLSTRLHGEPFSVAPHVCEAILAHMNGNTIASVYNRQNYLPERRAALAAWGEHIDRITADAAIIKLRHVHAA